MLEQQESKPRSGELSAIAAAEVLNRFLHRGHAGWYASGEGDFEFIYGIDHSEAFTPFEGSAIASQYLRNSRNQEHE